MSPRLLLAALLALCAACAEDLPGGRDAGGDAGARSDGSTPATDSGTPTADSGQTSPQDSGTDAGSGDAGAPMDAGRYTPYVYVSGGSGNIHRFLLNEADAGLSQQLTLSPGGNPSFLAFSPDKRVLYAAHEGSNLIRAYAIHPTTGALTPLNGASSGGGGPAHVAVDRTGKWVVAANYGGNTVAVLPVNPDGGLGPAVTTLGPGLNAHQAVFDAANQHLYVPCLGSDHVAQYGFDEGNGALTPLSPATVATDAGAGPRHLAFHPSAPLAYLINEKASTLTALSVDGAGRLTPLGTRSTLPAGVANNSTAEVLVHPSGAAVYGSNRIVGMNGDLVTFTPALDGGLAVAGHASTLGQTPRHFSLDPSGRLLFVANQNSGTIAAFRVDPATGALTSLGVVMSGLGNSSFVGVLWLPQP